MRKGFFDAKAQRSQRRKGAPKTSDYVSPWACLCVFAIFAPLREKSY